MKKDDSVFLNHIVDGAKLIGEYLAGASRDGFVANRMLQDAVIRELEVIGEATKNISEDLRSKYPDIPWNKMSGMRDKLIHGYFGVDLDAVWDTATKDIPELAIRIESILRSISR
ncbi:MAG: DUF86 domain-containing protein [Bacteroidota bacterium]